MELVQVQNLIQVLLMELPGLVHLLDILPVEGELVSRNHNLLPLLLDLAESVAVVMALNILLQRRQELLTQGVEAVPVQHQV